MMPNVHTLHTMHTLYILAPYKVSESLGYLKRAYERDPTNPAVLNQLANHYFFKAQYDKARVPVASLA